MTRVTAVVLTYNEQRHIVACLDTLKWADELVVFDSFSTDETIALAHQSGATIIQHPFRNFAQQRNDALHAATTEWVFFVDADERCTEQVADEIHNVTADDEHAVWAIPRENYLFGRLTRGAGWYPDFQARLFRVGYASFDPKREVHETALYPGEMGYLQHTLVHYNYDTVDQFHLKQRRYSELEAGILFKQGVRPKLRNYVLQPLREFKRRYINLRGYSDGFHGLRLCLLLAYYNYVMYRCLKRMWQKQASVS